jgi:hypothetical protein
MQCLSPGEIGKMKLHYWLGGVLLFLGATRLVDAAPLVVAAGGRSDAAVLVAAEKGWERKAADDLARYIGIMTGSAPAVIDDGQAIAAALKSTKPLLIVGSLALENEPSLKPALAKVIKQKPLLNTDGIVLKRVGNRVYLAGNNDNSHYYAVAELLRRWGCRWYVPTEFGECIPEKAALTVDDLDYRYGSPFEIRTYWISWNGDNTGAADFQRRNMMTGREMTVPTGHAIGKYVGEITKNVFKIPLTDPKTAEHIASKVEKRYAIGANFSLGMEDGVYDSDYPRDRELMKLQYDKYFMGPSVTDPMLELLNNVARILREKHPSSPSKIGFLAYGNLTIPPVRKMVAEPNLVCELAPIDIDPIHGMDDPQSPPRQEYKDMLYGWAKVMQGRLAIYDYDQGMLVWRDLPNPSHQAFRQDVKHYRKAGILGVNTESRNAIGTVFLNLHVRGRLLWNPDEDVDQILKEFYPAFYGPAAEPMSLYWTTIYDAWEKSIITEHEHFAAPAIYTPKVVEVLRAELQKAEKLIMPLRAKAKLNRNEKLYLERMKFTRHSFDIIDQYLDMVRAAAKEIDYAKAAASGEKGLKSRKAMAEIGGIFTSTKLESGSAAWWPGEVKQYAALQNFIDGGKGTLVAKMPLEWEFHRDAARVGVKNNYAAGPVDLAYWKANKDKLTLDSRKDYPDEWEMLSTDLYAQAQGVRHPDRQSFVGDLWYRTQVDLKSDQVKGSVTLKFPGLFNECWLYVNGKEVGYRKQAKLWWRNNYKFEWDVDLTDKLNAGVNIIAVRCNCEHHFGGMFRRPFLYRKN